MFKHSQAPPWHYSAVSAVQNHFIFSLNSSPKRQTSMSRWRQWEQCAGRSKNSAKLTALYCAFVTGLCPLRSVEKNPAILITQLSHTGQLGYIYPLNLLLRLLFVSFCYTVPVHGSETFLTHLPPPPMFIILFPDLCPSFLIFLFAKQWALLRTQLRPRLLHLSFLTKICIRTLSPKYLLIVTIPSSSSSQWAFFPSASTISTR